MSLKRRFVAPIILDSLPKTTKSLNTTEMMAITSNIFPYYKLSDSIDFSIPYPNLFNENRIKRLTENKENLPLFKVFVDTKQILTMDLNGGIQWMKPLVFLKPIVIDDEYIGTEEIDSVATANYENTRPKEGNYVQSYPLFIYSATGDTIYVEEQDLSIILIQEARDKDGIWKPIEYWRPSWCGNSYSTLIIPPNHFLGTKIVRYDGDFETDLRVKVRSGNQIVYSNTFKGKINRSQFELTKFLLDNLGTYDKQKKQQLNYLFLRK